jgi:beta-lactamase regulating signal transducer with metallopeptidase domain
LPGTHNGMGHLHTPIISSMRINLVTPFSEKDVVKALGARWDGAQKVWYIVDVSDLTPFIPWIPDLAAATDTANDKGVQKAPPKSPPSAAPGVLTQSSAEIPHCGCVVLPWADCEHTVNS